MPDSISSTSFRGQVRDQIYRGFHSKDLWRNWKIRLLIYLKKLFKIFGTCHVLGRRINLFIVWVLLICIYYVSAWSWVWDQPIWVLVFVSWKLVFPFWTPGKKTGMWKWKVRITADYGCLKSKNSLVQIILRVW